MAANPTLDLVRKVPMKDIASSGADPPAAINVAPAMSGLTPNRSSITSSDGTKKSSQIMASACVCIQACVCACAATVRREGGGRGARKRMFSREQRQAHESNHAFAMAHIKSMLYF